MKAPIPILVLCAIVALAGCGSGSGESTATMEKTKPHVAVPKGAPPKKLVVKDIEEGTGATAEAYDVVTVQYVGAGTGE